MHQIEEVCQILYHQHVFHGQKANALLKQDKTTVIILKSNDCKRLSVISVNVFVEFHVQVTLKVCSCLSFHKAIFANSFWDVLRATILWPLGFNFWEEITFQIFRHLILPSYAWNRSQWNRFIVSLARAFSLFKV